MVVGNGSRRDEDRPDVDEDECEVDSDGTVCGRDEVEEPGRSEAGEGTDIDVLASEVSLGEAARKTGCEVCRGVMRPRSEGPASEASDWVAIDSKVVATDCVFLFIAG